jgi:hypothetical protein
LLILLPANLLTINDVADVADFPDLPIILACCLFAAILCFCPSMFLPFPDQMAIFIQLLRRRKTKSSNMLPPVAAVLPAEKGNETLVKWALLPY